MPPRIMEFETSFANMSDSLNSREFPRVSWELKPCFRSICTPPLCREFPRVSWELKHYYLSGCISLLHCELPHIVWEFKQLLRRWPLCDAVESSVQLGNGIKIPREFHAEINCLRTNKYKLPISVNYNIQLVYAF